jgi:hypothetical protein
MDIESLQTAPRFEWARSRLKSAAVGVRAGQPLSHDMVLVPGAGTLQYVEGNIPLRDNASAAGTRRGRRTWHARTLHAREPGDLQSDRRRPFGPAARIGKARSRSRVSVRRTRLDDGMRGQAEVFGSQRCGKSSSTLLAGCVGSLSSTSRM